MKIMAWRMSRVSLTSEILRLREVRGRDETRILISPLALLLVLRADFQLSPASEAQPPRLSLLRDLPKGLAPYLSHPDTHS